MATLVFMEVHFTAEQEAQLSLAAGLAGMDSTRFVQDAALKSLESSLFRAAVRDGIAQADRGEFVEDDEVQRWLESQEILGAPK